MRKTFTAIVAAMILTLAGLTSAHALSIMPGRTEVHLLPGQKANMVFFVKNDHPEKLNIDVTQKNWFLYEANKDIAVDQWLKINGKTHFSLKPGQERKVPVTIFCPKNAQGVLIGMTSFTFRTPNPSMLTPRISASIYLSVDGTQRPAGEIRKMATRIWLKKLTVGVEVKATGNVHLRPSGTLTILNDKGAEAALFRVNEGDPVYPGQTRSYIGVRQGEAVPLAPGRYSLNAHLTAGSVTLDAERKFQVFEDGKVQMEGEDKPS